MAWRDWPYWLRGGIILGGIVIAIVGIAILLEVFQVIVIQELTELLQDM